MASRSLSPGGALLRASRVFAIPSPLPRPIPDMSSIGTFDSDTTTLPHPVHMSITTPQSSLVKGDWGLKRSLPLRATAKTSTPVIRVEKMDTYEHVTSFGSAADHTLSLQKWHEMDIPLSTPQPKQDTSLPFFANDRSVFEDEIDNTAAAETKSSTNIDARWKFGGPWLAGQTDGEFNAYLNKEIRGKKKEFRAFLREACSKALIREHLAQRASAADAGDVKAPPQHEEVTDEQLKNYIMSLRQDTTELNKQIRTFLDLPPVSARSRAESDIANRFAQNLSAAFGGRTDSTISSSPYSESGPPKTHPSAGLAYSRTASTLHNHPSFGPQLTKPPVEARIVSPRAVGGQAQLGLGGFVTAAPPPMSQHDPFHTSSRNAHPGLNLIEADKQGGSKVFVQPKSAWVDPKGRVVLKVVQADGVAVAIKQGEEIPQIGLSPRSNANTAPVTISRSVLRSTDDISTGYGV